MHPVLPQLYPRDLEVGCGYDVQGKPLSAPDLYRFLLMLLLHRCTNLSG